MLLLSISQVTDANKLTQSQSQDSKTVATHNHQVVDSTEMFLKIHQGMGVKSANGLLYIDRSDYDFIDISDKSKQLKLFRDVLAFNKLLLRNGLKVSLEIKKDDNGVTVNSDLQKLHINAETIIDRLPQLLQKIQASNLIQSVHIDSPTLDPKPVS